MRTIITVLFIGIINEIGVMPDKFGWIVLRIIMVFCFIVAVLEDINKARGK